MPQTINDRSFRVAFFSTVKEAEMAIHRLLAAGFGMEHLAVICPKEFQADLPPEVPRAERPGSHAIAGIVEGGLFTFANGTNPELMLFIEARQAKNTPSKPVWQFGVGRTSYAELHLEYEGKEVFSAPRGNFVAGRSNPFWTSTLEFKSPPAVRPAGN